MSPTPDEIREEERRLRRVRTIVTLTTAILAQGVATRSEAEALAASARRRILDLFPGREETYELLYAPRFRRLIDEQFRGPAAILPFKRS